jgi:hypothetical protein
VDVDDLFLLLEVAAGRSALDADDPSLRLEAAAGRSPADATLLLLPCTSAGRVADGFEPFWRLAFAEVDEACFAGPSGSRLSLDSEGRFPLCLTAFDAAVGALFPLNADFLGLSAFLASARMRCLSMESCCGASVDLTTNAWVQLGQRTIMVAPEIDESPTSKCSKHCTQGTFTPGTLLLCAQEEASVAVNAAAVRFNHTSEVHVTILSGADRMSGRRFRAIGPHPKKQFQRAIGRLPVP